MKQIGIFSYVKRDNNNSEGVNGFTAFSWLEKSCKRVIKVIVYPTPFF